MKTTLNNIDFISSSISKFILPTVRPKNNSTILRKLLVWFASSTVPVIKRYFDYSTEEINILKQGIKKFPREVLKSINTDVNDKNLTDYYSPDSIEQLQTNNNGTLVTSGYIQLQGGNMQTVNEEMLDSGEEPESVVKAFMEDPAELFMYNSEDNLTPYGDADGIAYVLSEISDDVELRIEQQYMNTLLVSYYDSSIGYDSEPFELIVPEEAGVDWIADVLTAIADATIENGDVLELWQYEQIVEDLTNEN